MCPPLRAGVTGPTEPTEPTARSGMGSGGDGDGDDDRARGGVRTAADEGPRAGCPGAKVAEAGRWTAVPVTLSDKAPSDKKPGRGDRAAASQLLLKGDCEWE